MDHSSSSSISEQQQQQQQQRLSVLSQASLPESDLIGSILADEQAAGDKVASPALMAHKDKMHSHAPQPYSSHPMPLHDVGNASSLQTNARDLDAYVGASAAHAAAAAAAAAGGFLRSTSAPPQLSLETAASIAVNGEQISPDDPRLTPAYYAYYYSQRPLDPRLPPPLLDYSTWVQSHEAPAHVHQQHQHQHQQQHQQQLAFSSAHAGFQPAQMPFKRAPEQHSTHPPVNVNPILHQPKPMPVGGFGLPMFSSPSDSSTSASVWHDKASGSGKAAGAEHSKLGVGGSPLDMIQQDFPRTPSPFFQSSAPSASSDDHPDNSMLNLHQDVTADVAAAAAAAATKPSDKDHSASEKHEDITNASAADLTQHMQQLQLSRHTAAASPSPEAAAPAAPRPLPAAAAVAAYRGHTNAPAPAPLLHTHLPGRTMLPPPPNHHQQQQQQHMYHGFHDQHVRAVVDRFPAPPLPQQQQLQQASYPQYISRLAPNTGFRQASEPVAPLSSYWDAPSYHPHASMAMQYAAAGMQAPFAAPPSMVYDEEAAAARHALYRGAGVARGRAAGVGGGVGGAPGKARRGHGAHEYAAGVGKDAAAAAGAAGGGGGALTSRAMILHELRTNKHHHHVRLSDVIQQRFVTDLATDQNGSRFIQQHLESSSDAQKQALFEQLLPETIPLCVDVFGNYVIQKFFEFGLPQHQRALAEQLRGNVLALSLQMYGCRVVQKALEVITGDLQIALVDELRSHVTKCVRDQNGNHVIQKCIEKVPSQHIGFIVNAFAGHVFSLSTHAYGCRVIQRLLEHCPPAQKDVILGEILDKALQLVVDQYGNYVIQHVIQRGNAAHRSNVIEKIQGRVCELSKHKFASNVIEKCFAFGSEEEKEALVSEVIGNEKNCPVASMVKDQYANYVVQKILGVVNAAQRDRLIETIRVCVPNLRKIAFGKHIVSRVEKLTGKVI